MTWIAVPLESIAESNGQSNVNILEFPNLRKFRFPLKVSGAELSQLSSIIQANVRSNKGIDDYSVFDLFSMQIAF